jgi:hypothetical protein
MYAAYGGHTQAGIDRRRAEQRLSGIEQDNARKPVPAPPVAAQVITFVAKEPVVDRLAYLDGPRYRQARDLIAMVACWHGLQVSDLTGDSRKRPITDARQDAMVAVYLCSRLRGEPHSLPRMGSFFNKDHTSIIHALRKRGVK